MILIAPAARKRMPNSAYGHYLCLPGKQWTNPVNLSIRPHPYSVFFQEIISNGIKSKQIELLSVSAQHHWWREGVRAQVAMGRHQRPVFPSVITTLSSGSSCSSLPVVCQMRQVHRWVDDQPVSEMWEEWGREATGRGEIAHRGRTEE